MGSKSLRAIAVMGFLAILAMTGLMFFSLDQVSEASGVKLAKRIHAEFERSLDPDAGPTKVIVRRLGKERDGRKHYTVRVWPTRSLARSEQAIERLSVRVAEEVFAELRQEKSEVTVTAVVLLPDASEQRRTYNREMKRIEEPSPPPARREQAAAK